MYSSNIYVIIIIIINTLINNYIIIIMSSIHVLFSCADSVIGSFSCWVSTFK
jgi:hypothetical protein